MQPLSYQILPASCWVTSMLNGIIFLFESNTKVPLLAYRLLHELLIEKGVFYYTKKELTSFEAIIKAVSTCTGLKIDYHSGHAVQPAIEALNFNTQVAVCDIGSGDHSILINGIKEDWVEGFDPYWDSVKKKSKNQ